MAFSSDNIKLTKQCNLFLTKKKLDKNLIKEINTAISDTRTVYKTLNNKIVITTSVWSIEYYFISFYIENEPSFFFSHTVKEKERKYGYIFVAEYFDKKNNSFIVVNKKNISINKDIIESYIDFIDQDKFSKMFITSKSEIKKINLSNINFSDYSIRHMQAEANNIAKSFSVLSSSSKKINSLQSLNNNKLQSIIPSTSKLNEIGQTVTFNEFNKWIVDVIDKYLNFKNPSLLFIDNFAISEVFSKKSSNLSFESLLILKHELVEKIEHNEIEPYLYDNKENKVNIDQKKLDYTLLNWLSDIDLCFEIDSLNQFNVPNVIEGEVENKTDYLHLKFKIFDKYFLKYVDSKEYISFQKYINQKQLFTISFKNSKFKYFDKKLFKENFPNGRGDEFKKLFVPFSELNATTEEKGVLTGANNFSANSIFLAIEQKIRTSNSHSYLVCDDMGNEWADFIGINDTTLTYFHAKSGDFKANKFSVSDFHIVISQAQKNIGYMFSPEKLHHSKFKKWNKKVKHTNIPMLSLAPTGSNASDFGIKLSELTYSSNVQREIIIVVNFISYIKVISELDKFNNGRGKPNNIQFIWLISSLYNTCIERNISLQIWCRD